MRTWILSCGLIWGSISILTQCNNDTTSCEKTMCTADFRMITVTLKDSIGNDYVPDKVETYYNGSLIKQDTLPSVPMQNVYTIIDDSNLQQIRLNINREVTFKIIKNGVVIKQQIYVVKADCCHVSKVNGLDTIIVN